MPAGSGSEAGYPGPFGSDPHFPLPRFSHRFRGAPPPPAARPGLTELPASHGPVESTLTCGATDMKVIRNGVTLIGESPAE